MFPKCVVRIEVQTAATATREQLEKTAFPVLWAKHTDDLFKRYDQDGDGFLSRPEVVSQPSTPEDSEGQRARRRSGGCPGPPQYQH